LKVFTTLFEGQAQGDAAQAGGAAQEYEQPPIQACASFLQTWAEAQQDASCKDLLKELKDKYMSDDTLGKRFQEVFSQRNIADVVAAPHKCAEELRPNPPWNQRSVQTLAESLCQVPDGQDTSRPAPFVEMLRLAQVRIVAGDTDVQVVKAWIFFTLVTYASSLPPGLGNQIAQRAATPIIVEAAIQLLMEQKAQVHADVQPRMAALQGVCARQPGCI